MYDCHYKIGYLISVKKSLMLVDINLRRSSLYTIWQFGVEVGVEESIVNAPPDCNSDQLFKSNFQFLRVFNMQFKKSVFLRQVVHQRFKFNLTFWFLRCLKKIKTHPLLLFTLN
jgi:hypothetical protein